MRRKSTYHRPVPYSQAWSQENEARARRSQIRNRDSEKPSLSRRLLRMVSSQPTYTVRVKYLRGYKNPVETIASGVFSEQASSALSSLSRKGFGRKDFSFFSPKGRGQENSVGIEVEQDDQVLAHIFITPDSSEFKITEELADSIKTIFRVSVPKTLVQKEEDWGDYLPTPSQDYGYRHFEGLQLRYAKELERRVEALERNAKY